MIARPDNRRINTTERLIMPHPSPWKILLVMTFVVACWAYSPTGIHIGLQAYDPGHLALLRFLVASVFMALIAAFKGIRLPYWRDVPLLFALGFFAVSLHHVALNIGQQSVSAGASSVLAQSSPLFSTLLARFWLKDRVSAWRWVCVLLGFVGVVIVVSGDKGLGDINAHALLILLAAVSWSVYFALQKHHARRYDGFSLACYAVWSGTLMLLIYLPGLGQAVLNAPLRVQWAVGSVGIGRVSQCAGLSGVGVCAQACGFEPGDDDVVSDSANGDGDCFGRVGGAADVAGAGGVGGGVDQCVGVESGAADWFSQDSRDLI